METQLKEPLLLQERKQESHHPLKGMAIYMTASFLNVFSRIMSKQAMVKSPEGAVTTFHILTVRSMGVIPINLLISMIFLKVDFHKVKSEYRSFVFCRSMITFLVSLLIFIAINYLPYSELQVICNMAPVITIFYAAYFLKERASFIEIACLIFCVAGLMIYANPGGIISKTNRTDDFKHGQNPSSVIGILLCLCTAFLTASVPIMNKILKSVHPTLLSTYQMIPGLLIPPLIMMYSDSTSSFAMTPQSLGYLFIGTLCFSLGTQLLTWSFHFEKASRLMMLKFLQIVYSIIFDLFLFGSTLRWTDYLGASLITLSVILISLFKCMGSVK